MDPLLSYRGNSRTIIKTLNVVYAIHVCREKLNTVSVLQKVVHHMT